MTSPDVSRRAIIIAAASDVFERYEFAIHALMTTLDAKKCLSERQLPRVRNC
ncbi:MAG: hypothetical protein M3Q00_13105 [Pseudomonadota bacterium]|nr:hypothetical protein [Pseudomonadota bacterium]